MADTRYFCLIPSLLILGGAALLHPSASTAATGGKIQFNRDIRPILSENCFACHGFDAKRRKAKLRLDVPEGAFAALEDRFPIKPGKLAESEVWSRVTSDDPEEQMPPPKSHKTLTPAQKETIKQWIEQGAPYQKHWSFEAPVKPPVPTVAGDGSGNPIDAFLHARLAEEGLNFSPEADRPTLIRRASFALTGLPPTLDEVNAFVNDQADGAYERVIDRYMRSPRFGEEMARQWLDVARYADTHGMHLDNVRAMWPYRDWVVRAFNANLPFDQFTIWQIAGDLLPNASPDQITATGFERCNVTTGEGGAITEEFLYRYAVDRTSTLTTAWMGLTGGCAVCHDHKYDPLTTKEFYSLYSFFASAADPGMDGNINLTPPFEKLPNPAQQQALEAASKAEAAAKKSLEEAATKTAYVDPADISPAPKKEAVTQVIFDDEFLFGAELRNTTRNAAVWDTDPAFVAKSGHRVLRQSSSYFTEQRIEPTIVPVVIPSGGVFEVWVRPDPLSRPEILAIDVENRRVFWGEETALNAAFGEKPTSVRKGPIPTPGEWTKLTFTADELKLTAGQRIASFSVQQGGGIAWWDRFALTGEIAPAANPLASFMAWWKGEAEKKKLSEIPGDLKGILVGGPAKPATADQRRRLLEFYLTYVVHPTTKDLTAKRTAWEVAQAARGAADLAIPASLVFHDLEKPRDAFVMTRGQYDKPGEKVEPSTPAFLPPLKKADPKGRATRLDLARWLVSSEHPLTARVTVNRFWQQFFGTGIVKTSHDLGSQGETPTHPELLDWLAVTFRESGWDVKSLVRLMVTSRAFRQQSNITEPLRIKDPDNRLYARGPRFRLDAEQIRDNALFVGGLLNLQVGGPGVHPYQPPKIWEPVGYADSNTRYYLQDHGDALYRRSLYCFLKRTAPPPFMSTFDAPNREQTCTRRERSNTPLQALQLMNDVQHFEAARALAERALQQGAMDDNSRAEWLFRVVLARAPDAKESTLLARALAAQRNLYTADPQAAEKAIRTGESTPKLIAPAPETAAWTLLANLVLNLDETITRN